MNKSRPSKRGTSQEINPGSSAVDEYLAEVPEPARGTLKRIRAQIRAAVPAETTEGISYRIPMFKYKGVLIWYAGFTDHCSLFPTAAAISAFRNELKGFKTSKGTVHFPVDKPFPAALLKKIVKFRLAQVEQQKKRA